MPFSQLGLDPKLVDAVKAKGYDKPTPIQQKAIPAILEGRDLIGGSQTGTGKTAAFTLPILQRLSKTDGSRHPRALILTPTRELAAQIGESVTTYGKHLPLKSTVIFGGVGDNPQKARIRAGIDILIACPGRLLDLHNQGSVDLSKVETFILDEADRMLDMGFIHDIKRIVKHIPAKRQTLLFSATYSKEIRELADRLLEDPVSVEVTPRNSTVEKVDQLIYHVHKGDKRHLLADLIREGEWTQVLVFTRTKHGANRLATQLDNEGIPAAAIHGNKSQGARTKNLADFKSNKLRVLVATDIAARGLDIKLLPHVVNFELPNVPEDYVHRIGRTGRAGAGGQAISLVCGEEGKLLWQIEKLLKRDLPRKDPDGYEKEDVIPNPPKPVKIGGGGGGGGRNRPNKNSFRRGQKESSRRPNRRNRNSSGGGGRRGS